ncbi:MAG: ester cyclase [Pseudonocardiaceae bacterium]|nr:ester cyclase [Pseudonocardiaceae bacterium]
MTGNDISRLARRFYERLAAGDSTGAVELVGAGYVGHGLGAGGGPASVKKDIDTWLAAVPDLRIDVHDTVAEGDRVALRMTLRGTQSGRFAGIPASGKPFEIGATDVVRVADGAIVEAWTLCDLASMFSQLGALPSTAPAAPEAARS